MTNRLLTVLLAGALLLVCGRAASAQAINSPPPPNSPERLPPALLLGQRVERVRLAASLAPIVVIVEDPESYIEAVASWTPTLRFPVLIDDGSFDAREDIARFVRAFAPTKVVRWKAPHASPAPFAGVDAARFTGAVARAWGVQKDPADQNAVIERWKELSHQPPGLVLVSTEDTAWTAGLALCAARGQIATFVKARQGVDGALTAAEADALAGAASSAADASTFTWRVVGDTLEAVTLCLNTPSRMDRPNGEWLAVTDRIGRHGSGPEAKDRWAWCGQVFGNSAVAAYRAMCSLFLSPRDAWIFDSYSDSKPWSDYDGTAAGKLLTDAGMKVEVSDKPQQGERDWRVRAARAVNADLFLVNSSGNVDFFNLEPGQCKPGDVPMLGRPAAVHMVHSWSLLFPANRDTVGGRWLANGAFAYCGSVHEPYLNAFVPTPAVAGRLAAGAPFAAAVRHDRSPLWKIAIIGDPLYTMGPGAPRVEEGFPLAAVEDVAGPLREALTGGDFAKALRILALTGRDEDAAKIAGAIIKDKPEAMTHEVAAEAAMPLFRAGANRTLFDACLRFKDGKAPEATVREAIWLAAYPLLSAPDETVLTVLLENLRPHNIGRDAAELGRAWAKVRGARSANAMLSDVRVRLTDPGQREAFDKALRESPVR